LQPGKGKSQRPRLIRSYQMLGLGRSYPLRLARARLLPRPMKTVFRRIAQHRRLDLLSVVELFARAGDFHTIEYANQVRKLELWEIEPGFAPILQKRFPRAAVRTVDTYARLQTAPTLFDVVVGDAPVSEHGGRYEHFGIFPAVFSWLADEAFLILDIIPFVTADARRAFPRAFDDGHMRARSLFYGTDRPDHIQPSLMVTHYCALCEAAGWTVFDTLIEPRKEVLSYLMLALRRKNEQGSATLI
jgi:hypothetical protein